MTNANETFLLSQDPRRSAFKSLAKANAGTPECTIAKKALDFLWLQYTVEYAFPGDIMCAKFVKNAFHVACRQLQRSVHGKISVLTSG